MSEEIQPNQQPEQSGKQDQIEQLKLVLMTDMKDGIIVRTQCRLCKSPFRKEAEEMFSLGRPVPQIRLFLEQKGEAIQEHNIRNHLKEHYQSLERRAALMDYLDNVAEIRKRRQNNLAILELTIDIDTAELLRWIPMPTNGDLYKDKERTDMIMKLNRSIRDGITKLMEIDSAETQVKGMRVKFLQVWKGAIDSAKDETERQMLIGTLSQFKELLDTPGAGS